MKKVIFTIVLSIVAIYVGYRFYTQQTTATESPSLLSMSNIEALSEGGEMIGWGIYEEWRIYDESFNDEFFAHCTYKLVDCIANAGINKSCSEEESTTCQYIEKKYEEDHERNELHYEYTDYR